MATTALYTARDLCEEALRLIGVVALDEPMDADTGKAALMSLNLMIKGWQNKEYSLWLTTSQTLNLTTAASYTLNPKRPFRIESARLVRSGIETPMWAMTRNEYDNIPQKASTGLPTTFYYDRQKEDALFYVWPVLAAANGETVKITYEREFEDLTDLSENPDIPGEWWETVAYNLASRLSMKFGVDAPKVDAYAKMTLDEALAADREGSVYFGEPR